MYVKSLTLQGLQVLRLGDDAAPRAGHHLHRRAQRLRQVQRRRRPRLGHGRAGRQEPARRQDGGRHLRRHRRAARRSAGPRSALTIDNTDGALPIDYTEVTISRTMFRNGGSEYAINGTSCRLLDVQELLSDSGIGREMHVIVGQGQLDAVLRATPEERRGFIEEAAGVLKHRKRKEKALRKLEAMEANLTRVNDLTGEIRRQLGPLGRQAEAARRAAVIQADARDARLRLLADDLVQLHRARSSRRSPTRPPCVARRTEVEEALRRRPRSRLAALEQEAAGGRARAGPGPGALVRPVRAARAADLDRVAGRRAGAPARRGRARRRRPPGRDPEELRGAGRRGARAGAGAARRGRARPRTALEAAVAAPRRGRERRTPPSSSGWPRLVRAAADRREGLARLAGQVGARRSRIEAGEAEIGRLRRALVEQAPARAADAEREFAELEAQVAGDEEGEEGLDADYEQAAADARGRPRPRSSSWREAERAAERDRTSAAARARGARARACAARTAPPRCSPPPTAATASLGSVAALLHGRARPRGRRRRRPRLRPPTPSPSSRVDAAAAALAPAARRTTPAGPALLVGATARRATRPAGRALPDGRRAGPATSSTRPDARAPGRRRSCSTASRSSPTSPTPRRSSRRERRASPRSPPTATCSPRAASAAAAATAPSLLEVQAAVDETPRPRRRRRPAAASRRGSPSPAPQERRRRPRERGRGAPSSGCTTPTPGWPPSPSGSASSAPRSGRPRPRPSAPSAAIADASGPLEADRAELAELQRAPRRGQRRAGRGRGARHRRARPARREAARPPGRRDRGCGSTLRTARGAGPGAGRARRLPRAGRRATERAARERAAARRERRAREAAVAEAVARGADVRRSRCVATSLDAGRPRQRAAAEAARTERDGELASVRARGARACGDELRELTDTVHRDEVARTQQRLRIEALQAKARRGARHRPGRAGRGVRPAPARAAVARRPRRRARRPPSREPAAVRARGAGEAAAHGRARARRCSGRVNPLALEEFAALEERHEFLTEQLEDLKSSRARPARHRHARSTSGSSRSSPRPSTTPPRSSSASSRGCSPAARAGWCSPTPTTC